MTMAACSGTRHMACKSCRERKVRCDGEFPSCGRCIRSRENCIYVPASNSTKADLVETVEGLQDRLHKAEASLAAMQSRDRVQSIGSQQDAMASGIQLPVDGLTMSSFEYPVPMSADGSSVLDWSSLPSISDTFSSTSEMSMMNSGRPIPESPRLIAHPKRKARLDLAQSSNPSSDNPSPLSNSRSNKSSSDSLPSLGDIRRWIATPVMEGLTTYPNENTDTPVLAGFKEFVLTYLVNQAKIAGVAAAMADYISWTRVRGEQGSDGTIGTVLEMFEARAREIAGLAENDGVKARQQAKSIMGQFGSQEQVWRALDTEIALRKGRLSAFFDKNYDIHSPVEEQ